MGLLPNDLANHETFDLHEMINFKSTCIIKSKLMSGVVFDQELKGLMEKDVQQSMMMLETLREFYKMPNPNYGENK